VSLSIDIPKAKGIGRGPSYHSRSSCSDDDYIPLVWGHIALDNDEILARNMSFGNEVNWRGDNHLLKANGDFSCTTLKNR